MVVHLRRLVGKCDQRAGDGAPAPLSAIWQEAESEANRNALVRLVVSNLFGQNAAAIADAEAAYETMWAQDVAAMVGYHTGASAAAA